MGALDDKQFGVTTSDGSMGDEGIAIKNSTKFDGKGEAANPNVSAAQAQLSGRQ